MDILETVMLEIEGVMNHVDRKQLVVIAKYFQNKHRVFVDGEGRSGLMAKGFAMRLMHLGIEVYVIGETITPAFKKGDILVSVSGSGTSVAGLHNVSKGKDMGVEVIAVTSKDTTPLAKQADAVLVVPGVIKSDSGGERGSIQLLSSLFDQCLHITLDALCLLIAEEIQVSNDTATKTHW